MLADYIRTQRKRLRFTQFGLALRLGVSTRTIGAWERDGEATATVPNAYQIRRMAALFGVSADELLARLPPERKQDS